MDFCWCEFDSSYPKVNPARTFLERNLNENTKRCGRSDLLRTFWTDSPFLKYVYLRNLFIFNKLQHPRFFCFQNEICGFFLSNFGVSKRDPMNSSHPKQPKRGGSRRGPPQPPRPQGVKRWWHNRGGSRRALGGWGVGDGILWFETRFWWEKKCLPCFL